ncbi:hypothetical protein Tco_0466390 [Tanacetum coccineum]
MVIIRPEDEYERVLWGDLKVMFEPDIKSKVWRDLQDCPGLVDIDTCEFLVRLSEQGLCGEVIRRLRWGWGLVRVVGGVQGYVVGGLGLSGLVVVLGCLVVACVGPISAAGEKVYAARLQLLEDFLLSRG